MKKPILLLPLFALLFFACTKEVDNVIPQPKSDEPVVTMSKGADGVMSIVVSPAPGTEAKDRTLCTLYEAMRFADLENDILQGFSVARVGRHRPEVRCQILHRRALPLVRQTERLGRPDEILEVVERIAGQPVEHRLRFRRSAWNIGAQEAPQRLLVRRIGGRHQVEHQAEGNGRCFRRLLRT